MPPASLAALLGLALSLTMAGAGAGPADWRLEWPRTDFSKRSVELREIRSGGPPKDGIPPIDQPIFEPLAGGKPAGWAERIADNEPVIGLMIGGDARAYPLRILIWHEIVNDTVGGVPVAVTYCPLCNAALVFERRLGERVFDFGTTGKLRNSDLVMYDRQTESWWQQFGGDAIVGELTGSALKLVPSRLESFARFRARFPDGKVLVPRDPRLRPYGSNPYVGYDAIGTWPFLFQGSVPEGLDPMERVVAVEVAPGRHEAWTLELLRRQREIRAGDLVLKWEAGQASALDQRDIAAGRDVGNVVVQRRVGERLEDVAYDLPFLFAFHAFRPDAPIHRAR
jgi:hypothetical protein